MINTQLNLFYTLIVYGSVIQWHIFHLFDKLFIDKRHLNKYSDEKHEEYNQRNGRPDVYILNRLKNLFIHDYSVSPTVSSLTLMSVPNLCR